jgi:hypothetical protein
MRFLNMGTGMSQAMAAAWWSSFSHRRFKSEVQQCSIDGMAE